MSFIEDLGKGLTYAFPVVAAANGIGDIGDAYWGNFGMEGPGNQLTGGSLQGGGLPFGLGGGGGEAPTAAQLTPEQQAAIAGGYTNPSTGAPVVGYTQPVTQGGAIGAGQSYGATPQPIYGPSVRDQAMAGFNAGPREAPQMQGAQMAQPANVQGATINTGYMQPGQQTSDMGKAAAYGSLGAARDARGQQQSQTQRLTSAADGRTPSVAENQLRAGLTQGLQNNLAMAASNRGSGSSAVLAQRQAQNANAALSARTNAQAASLRAGEMAQARGELSQHLGQVRGQDLATAGVGTQMMGVGTQQMGIGAQLGTAQAGLTQQADLANQQTAFQTGQANLSAAQQTQIANLNAQMTQQGMDDQQKMAYLGAVLGIDARTQQGQMQLQQLLVNAKLTTDATNAGIGMNNTNAAVNQQNGILSGAATFGAALI
jgi:hypothetical protein